MRTARLAAWACIASGALAVGWSARPLPARALLPAPGRPSTPAARATQRDSGSPLPDAVAARDVFRAARRPAGTAYDPQAVAPQGAAVLKPMLALVGVVSGDDPTAVIDGFPGVEGSRVVRIGDVVGGLAVRRIAGGEVRVAGMDTVWVLKVRAWR